MLEKTNQDILGDESAESPNDDDDNNDGDNNDNDNDDDRIAANHTSTDDPSSAGLLGVKRGPTFHPSWYDSPTKRVSNPRKEKGREEMRRTFAKVFPHLESPPTMKNNEIDEDDDAWNDIITSPVKEQSPAFKDQYYYI